MSKNNLKQKCQEFQNNMLDIVNIKRNPDLSTFKTIAAVTKKGAKVKELSSEIAELLEIPKNSKTVDFESKIRNAGIDTSKLQKAIKAESEHNEIAKPYNQNHHNSKFASINHVLNFGKTIAAMKKLPQITK